MSRKKLLSRVSAHCGDPILPLDASGAAHVSAAAGAETAGGSGVSVDCGGGGKDGEVVPDRVGAQPPPKKRRNVVRVRIPLSAMPTRWDAPRPPFETCLDNVRIEDKLGEGLGSLGILDEVKSQSWLCSGAIDVGMAKLARSYPSVHFMATDFTVWSLRGWNSSSANDTTFRDILGRPIVFSEKKPVVFFLHVNNNHWNLLRVEHDPVPELQLFEPMGKPPRRGTRAKPGASSSASRVTSFRCVPKEVYRWLDTMWPLSSSSATPSIGSKRKTPSSSRDGWASRTRFAISNQQQTTGFDCGVASLLYAEKCGQGVLREDIDAWTSQGDLTQYRKSLQRYLKDILTNRGASAEDPPASPASGSEIADHPAVSPSQDPSKPLSSPRMGEPGSAPVPRNQDTEASCSPTSSRKRARE